MTLSASTTFSGCYRDSPPCLNRPSPEVCRLLGGDHPVLLIAPDRVRSWLGAGLQPPTLHIPAGRETEMLSSCVLARLVRLNLPVIIRFAGPRQATAHAGTRLEWGPDER
jgi:hypothetical protein